MVERNVGLPPEKRIEFRIGIHLGDVVEEEDGDLMGDGVNIASRLEGDTNALVTAIAAQGGTKVTTQHFATDHGWSDHRIALQATIIAWLQKLSSSP